MSGTLGWVHQVGFTRSGTIGQVQQVRYTKMGTVGQGTNSGTLGGTIGQVH